MNGENVNIEKSLVTIIILLFVLIIPILSAFKTVKAGTVRVVTRFGRVTGRVLQPGFNIVVPIIDKTITYNTKKVTYETALQESQKTSKADYKDYPVDTTTSDGQGVKLTYTIRFSVDSTKATWLANNIGGEEAIVEKVVKTDSRAWTRTIVRDFTSTDLYSGNIREVQDKIFDTLQPKFADNGLTLDELLLREPRFANDFEKVMEAEQVAKKQVEVEKQVAEQEKYRKEARITEAEGKAREQELQRETLSAQVLEKTKLDVMQTMADALKISAEKGQPIKIIPDTVLGDNQGLIFQLPN